MESPKRLISLKTLVRLSNVMLFAVAILFRELWTRGGPDIYYWLGNFSFGTMLAVSGVVLIVQPHIFGGKRPMKKYVRFLVVVVTFAIATLFCGVSLFRVLLSCAPTGPCPP
jgi:hypothetical protein